MRSAVLSLFALLSFAAAPVAAQPVVQARPGKVVAAPSNPPSVEPLPHSAGNMSGTDTHSEIAPSVRALNLPRDATAADYLRAAQSALADGQTGRAHAALVNAETLLLTRGGTAGTPDQDPAVSNIRVALNALAEGGTLQALGIVQHTIPMADQSAAIGGPGSVMPPG